MKRRIISLILSLAMLLSVLPVNGLYAEDVAETTKEISAEEIISAGVDLAGREATLKAGSKLYAGVGSNKTYTVTSDRKVVIDKQHVKYGVIWYSLSDNGGIGLYNFVKAEDLIILPVTVEATVEGKKFNINGQTIPVGTELSVRSVASDAFFEKINDGESLVFDIDLSKNGAKIEPNGRVEVTISNVFAPFTLEEGDSAYIYLYHFLDDADAIAKAVENETAGFISEDEIAEMLGKEIPSSLSEAVDAAVSAGLGRGLVVEVINADVYEDGSISFYAESFSMHSWNGSRYNHERYETNNTSNMLVMLPNSSRRIRCNI